MACARLSHLRAREQGALLHLAIHAHFGGRPLVTAMLHRILDHFGRFDGVWFARHAEIAKYTAEQALDQPLLTARLRRTPGSEL